MLEKKPEELSCGIRPLRIGVGAGETATRPGMTGSVNDPLLEDDLPTRIMIEGAAVASGTGYPAVLNRHSQVGVRVFPKLRDDLIAVAPPERIDWTIFPIGAPGVAPEIVRK